MQMRQRLLGFLNKVTGVRAKQHLHHHPEGLEGENLPRHIAFIMDGNGRWAKERGLSRSFGHAEGSRILKEIVKDCYNLHIRYVTVYAFSTENWARPKSEVDQLMKLLLDYLNNAEADLEGRKVRIRIIGSREGLSAEILAAIQQVQSSTAHNMDMDFIIAINYGGRQEILQAVQHISEDAKQGKIQGNISEEIFESYLYTGNTPAPDLLIRTSGEQRLSNFLLWQCAYTEFVFPTLLWPDFRQKHLHEALQKYSGRSRRFGGIDER